MSPNGNVLTKIQLTNVTNVHTEFFSLPKMSFYAGWKIINNQKLQRYKGLLASSINYMSKTRQYLYRQVNKSTFSI